MDKHKVYLSEPAESDLRDIVRYISSQLDAPITALKMMDLFEDAMGSLEEMPHRCPLLSDERLATMGYRKLHVKNYFVFYTIDEIHNVVDVERILHSRRDWQRIL